MTDAPAPSPPPIVQTLGPADLRAALAAGWRDYRAAPVFGLFFSAVYVAGGLVLTLTLGRGGNLVWALPFAVGFPLLAPFAAVGLYEVSRRLEAGQPLDWRPILGVVLAEKDRQVPWMAFIIIFLFLVWIFVGHMIFAVFMGLQPMTNVSSSMEIYLTPNGLAMLAMGSVVGAFFAFVLYAVTVVSLPLLLDREIDFASAMIASFSVVTRNFATMTGWAALIAVLLAIGMLPGFLGLFVVLPLLGHASWHLYRRAVGFADRPAAG
ncbi:MAG: DUF2189 domain-containing protein [Rhodobacteraceae bacterium]|jgi:uncharacterized membrane protein|nr:DUF2189 domain-containing protein [Paracoccaceae bacterium]MBL4557506.1 DUF2189 domain-containing protein [Paracoccaceae bacterium]HBG99442.1 hypothetical protein [Paracoccaceae bacterium]